MAGGLILAINPAGSFRSTSQQDVLPGAVLPADAEVIYAIGKGSLDSGVLTMAPQSFVVMKAREV